MATRASIADAETAAIPRHPAQRRLAGRGLMAVVDQGFISGSNFLLGVLLARWLPAEQFGAYAIAFAVFLLVSQLYQSLISEPMSVFGGSAYRSQVRHYVGRLLWVHGGMSVIVAALLALAAGAVYFFARGSSLAPVLAAMSVVAPCVLLFWMSRRASYLELPPWNPAVAAVSYCALLLGMLWLLQRAQLLSATGAFFAMGAAGLLASLFLFFKLRPVVLSRNDVDLAAVWQRHWAYGRWALAGSWATWVPSNVFYLFLGGTAGLAAPAELRALLNFSLPLGQTVSALALVVLPHAAGLRLDAGDHIVQRFTLKMLRLYLAGAFLYWMVVVIFRDQVFHFLYAGKYAAAASLVPWIALASMFQIATYAMTLGLRAMEKPDSIFWAYLGSSLLAVAVGFPAAGLFGLRGAIAAMIAAHAAAFATAAWYLTRRSPAPQPLAVEGD